MGAMSNHFRGIRTQDCKVCYGPHDDEIHESTLRIRLWFRHHVTRNFWDDVEPGVEPGVEPEVEFEDPALATELP